MPDAILSIDDYVRRLREELSGADAALVQDAVYDATQHLRSEVEAVAAEQPALSEAERVAVAIERFGSPDEIAEAYRRTEATVAAALAPPRPRVERTGLARVFGIFVDPRAYGSLFYLLLCVATGIIQFTWVAAGVSLSLGLSLLIIGVPFVLFFIATTRVLALVEGRVVEVLLGERMPRRPIPAHEGRMGQRILSWLKDRRTWTTMLYMVLLLPLGLFYFTLFATLISITVGLGVAPFAAWIAGHPVILNLDSDIVTLDAPWLAPLLWLVAFGLLFVTLHLARGLGTLHGRFAKLMLVQRGDAVPASREAASRALGSSLAH